MRDEAPNVDGEIGAIHGVHVLAEGLPLAFVARAENDVDAGHRRPRRVAGSHPGAAVPDDICRHTLHQLEVHARAHHRIVIVRVHVDKPRRDRQAGRVDLARRLTFDRAHGSDATVTHGHIRAERERAAAVDNAAVANVEIEFGHGGSHGIKHVPSPSTRER